MNATEYHNLSSHLEAFLPTPRRVDPALLPRPYKLYRDLPPQLIPERLDALLRYSNGIVRRRTVNGVERAYRAASCTGGAYHIEAYVITATGVFHYGAHDHALRLLRPGDHRHSAAEACALDHACETFVVLTSVFYRNAWRYENRAYRHIFWDAGTVLANLEALAADQALPLQACVGFVDAAIDHLLGLDPDKEFAVCVVALGPPADAPSSPDAPPMDHALVPASRVEIEYPRIAGTHAAGALASPDEVKSWRHTSAAEFIRQDHLYSGELTQPYTSEPVEAIIERRTSARRFTNAPLPAGALGRILAAADAPTPFDVPPVTTTHVLPRDAANAHLALDQPLAAEAAVNVYFATDLAAVLRGHGDRGYRLAQLEGGLRGGRVYLAATARRIKATGLTFYDDAARRALGADPMFLVAVGP